jgi:hypothetical protein
MARNRMSKTNGTSPRGARRRRATVGDLIAAAYDAMGPGVRPEEIARFLAAPDLARALRTRFRVA